MHNDNNIPEKLLKPYSAKETEDRIYDGWQKSGFFNPDVCIEKGVTDTHAEAFSIVLPPPNVTGTLHTGHALMLAVEDIMVRFARMQGKKTLWLPGTDHAAIATQSKVEKIVEKEEGKRKQELGREEFLKRVNKFAQESHDTIVGQAKKMGASLDWSREAFTLDDPRNLAVRTTFLRMYNDGLIYRGHRIVNWDPKGQTVISDDEMVYTEEKTKFYYLKYGPFTIGTARPETKFGDKYVVMHPEDARYAEYRDGQKLTLEWINGPIEATIIKDPMIDMEFGTGVMTITPWHSVADFELAEKYKLDKEQIIDKHGKLLPIAGEFAGMKIAEARGKIVEKMSAKGLVEKIEDYTHNIPTAERTGATIEPQVMNQWFINVNKPIPYRENKTLKELMLNAVRSGETKILPDRFENVYFNWIENLRDWCISRQIWYGHRIPVWYDKDGSVHLQKEQKVILARHGESEANRLRQFACGESMTPLTDKGREQAHALGESLRGHGVTKIITSPLSRAKETAEIVAKAIGYTGTIEEWDEYREYNCGALVGTPWPEKGLPFRHVSESNEGESVSDLEVRAKKVFEKLQEVETDGTILMVGHNGFNCCLSATLQGIHSESFVRFAENNDMANAGTITFTVLQNPKGENLEQDEDTLDTWFSSGLWTFSTLGWPNSTSDQQTYHPTTVLETGYDIIFFWVARMILMSTYLLGEVPFKTAYLHGLVRDEKGRKMSKSLGNIIDPLTLVDKFGADALRMAMVVGVGPGNDSNLGEEKIKAYSKFANKLWNIERFILENTAKLDRTKTPVLDAEDQATLDEIDALLKEITEEMEEYKFYIVAEKLYHYTWHTFADVVIERSKQKIADGNNAESAQWILVLALPKLISALHPFMPFLTEELWSMLPEGAERPLIVSSWPCKA